LAESAGLHDLLDDRLGLTRRTRSRRRPVWSRGCLPVRRQSHRGLVRAHHGAARGSSLPDPLASAAPWPWTVGVVHAEARAGV